MRSSNAGVVASVPFPAVLVRLEVLLRDLKLDVLLVDATLRAEEEDESRGPTPTLVLERDTEVAAVAKLAVLSMLSLLFAGTKEALAVVVKVAPFVAAAPFAATAAARLRLRRDTVEPSLT